MDLELSDEQNWLTESVETLLSRHGGDARLWAELVEFGALSVGEGELGAIELCLISRALGKHLAVAPFIASAAIRWAALPFAGTLPAAVSARLATDASVGLAQVEGELADKQELSIEHGDTVDALLVVASADDDPAFVLVPSPTGASDGQARVGFDPSIPFADVAFEGVNPEAVVGGELAASLLERLNTIGALLAAAESVGAAGELLHDAVAYAGERKQFGHTIASNQALRHLLADMYVRQSSSWSTVLYAAAALDDDAPDSRQTVAVAKAYVARAAREVAHGALQVFGGIAFTAEHPAHRFLRRIVVRERQFGDAAHHERALGQALAAAARPLELAEGVA